MSDRYTATMRVDALPPELAAMITHRPIPNAWVRVTLEVEEPTREEWLEAARAGAAKGRAEIDAGLGVDGETALRGLYEKHFGDRAK